MGTYYGAAIPADKHRIWLQNDGIVNTVSMRGPSNAKIVMHNPKKSLKKGVWTDMRLSYNTDHFQIVGHYVLDDKWLKDFYAGIINNLMKMKRL